MTRLAGHAGAVPNTVQNNNGHVERYLLTATFERAGR